MTKSRQKMVVYFLLIVLSIVFLTPFLWMIVTSLKSGEEEIFTYPPQLIPKVFHWENYSNVLKMYPWGTFLINSSIITFLAVVGTILSSSLIAFSFARLRFPGRETLFYLVLSTMMFPYYSTLIPQYILFTRLGWVDTLKPLWVPNFFGSAFFIFLLRQFFMGIPSELDDAARIDGCNTFQIYYKIYLPLAKPALITIAILVFMSAWGDFIGPLIYLHSEENYTLTLALNTFRGIHSTNWEYLMAATILISFPSIIFFFIGQKYIIGGITISGIK